MLSPPSLASPSPPRVIPVKFRRKSLTASDVETDAVFDLPRLSHSPSTAYSSSPPSNHFYAPSHTTARAYTYAYPCSPTHETSSSASSPMAHSTALDSTPSSPTHRSQARIRYQSSPIHEHAIRAYDPRDDDSSCFHLQPQPAAKRARSSWGMKTSSTVGSVNPRPLSPLPSLGARLPRAHSFAPAWTPSDASEAMSDWDLDPLECTHSEGTGRGIGPATIDEADDSDTLGVEYSSSPHRRCLSFSTSAEREKPIVRPPPVLAPRMTSCPLLPRETTSIMQRPTSSACPVSRRSSPFTSRPPWSDDDDHDQSTVQNTPSISGPSGRHTSPFLSPALSTTMLPPSDPLSPSPTLPERSPERLLAPEPVSDVLCHSDSSTSASSSASPVTPEPPARPVSQGRLSLFALLNPAPESEPNGKREARTDTVAFVDEVAINTPLSRECKPEVDDTDIVDDADRAASILADFAQVPDDDPSVLNTHPDAQSPQPLCPPQQSSPLLDLSPSLPSTPCRSSTPIASSPILASSPLSSPASSPSARRYQTQTPSIAISPVSSPLSTPPSSPHIGHRPPLQLSRKSPFADDDLGTDSENGAEPLSPITVAGQIKLSFDFARSKLQTDDQTVGNVSLQDEPQVSEPSTLRQPSSPNAPTSTDGGYELQDESQMMTEPTASDDDVPEMNGSKSAVHNTLLVARSLSSASDEIQVAPGLQSPANFTSHSKLRSTTGEDVAGNPSGDKKRQKDVAYFRAKKRPRLILSESESETDDHSMDKRPNANLAAQENGKKSKTSKDKASTTGRKPGKAIKHKPRITSDAEVENDIPFASKLQPTKKNLAPSQPSDSSQRRKRKDKDDTQSTARPQPVVTTLDLPLPLPLAEMQGMLIETLATSRASSLPASSLYKGLIASRPALKESPSLQGEGTMSGKEWMNAIDSVLEAGCQSSGVFGKVENSAKDAADHELETQWFYVPERDEDQERAGLIRSMMPRPGKRSETKKSKQYYWRPLAKISKWDPEDDL